MASGHHQVLAYGQIVEQFDRLPRARQPAPRPDVGPLVAYLVARQGNRSGERHESADGIDEGGLAGTVRSDQTDQLAVLDIEVDVDQCSHTTERDRDVACCEDVA